MDRPQRLNIKRILANAFARRIAYVVIALVLAWLGMGDAKAQHGACPTGGNCTREQAWNACQVAIAADDAYNTNPNTVFRCTTGAGATAAQGAYSSQSKTGSSWATYGSAFRWYSGCSAGQEWNPFLNQCKTNCTGRPSSIGSYTSMVPAGSVACIDGCEAMVSPIGDGTYTRTFIGGTASQCGVLPNDCSQNGPGYIFNAVTSMCQPTPQECAENQVKDPVTGVCSDGCPSGMTLDANGVCKPKQEDCPAGNVRAPSGQCLPGDGQCAAGEARRENGTCGKDSDGDGQADEDDEDTENDPDKESASGGDSCNAPPSCSGGAIACMQVKIQWRIDCNTRTKVNISGGACSAMPVCTGENCNAMEYAQLLQQWKAACNLEKLLAKDGGEGEGGQPEWTKVNGMSQNPGAGETGEDAPVLHERELQLSELDGGGFGGGGGSCPALIAGGASGSGMGGSFAQALATPPPFWCSFIGYIYGIMALSGAVAACVIVAKGWG